MTQSIGPPSLAQGTRIAVGFSTSISRFIPACGELSKPSWAIVQLDGSSPLARGTQDLDRLGYVADRFIPAYAGNSWRLRYSCGLVPVHPRLRGELAVGSFSDKIVSGSSPLTRGTQLAIRQRERGRRFIPAYAGNSRVRESLLFDSAVHPRLRGELKVKVKKVFILLGSSPLTRGTHQSIDEVRVNARFIPAYAGNSSEPQRFWQPVSVHPRLRGELAKKSIYCSSVPGSSPLTRGTLQAI